MTSTKPTTGGVMYVDLLRFDAWANKQIAGVRCMLNRDGTVNVKRLTDHEMDIRTAESLRKNGLENQIPSHWKDSKPEKTRLFPKKAEDGEEFLEGLPYIYDAGMQGYRAEVHKEEVHLAS